MADRIEVNGVQLWHEVNGQGEPILQIHGSGFGHYNLAPATPILSQQFQCIDYDQRGYGQSDHPDQSYDLDVWADDAAALLDVLGHDSAHVHGTSMGAMVSIVLCAKHPERIRSVVLNCGAAKLGLAGQLVFRNWIDIARLDGVGSRTLAELISWQALSRTYLETREGREGINMIQQILRDSNTIEPFTAACQAMIDMDIRDQVSKITAPALVLGGDQDIMTPWDQGPNGAGQQWIADHLPNGETYVIKGSGHSTVFDNTEEHCRVVGAFFARHSG